MIRAEKQWMHELFRRLAGRPAPPIPTPRATCSTCVYEGALVQATAGGEPDAIGRAREAVADVLG